MTLPPAPPTRVLVADDDPILLDALTTVLAEQKGLEVVASVPDGAAAVEATTTRMVDVALLDVNMPILDGIEAARQIASSSPATAVVILTAFERDDFLGRALACGARGFLTKDAAVEEIVRAIEVSRTGGVVMSPRPTAMLADSCRRNMIQRDQDVEFVAAVEALPPSLREVFEQIAQVSTNRQIAARTGLAPSTVRDYVSEVLLRTGCASRGEVAVRAVASGLR